MTRIPDLALNSAPASGDQIVTYSQANGDTRRISLSALQTFLAAALAAPAEKVTQYASPSASPFTVTIPAASQSVWLVLTPTGTLAVGTINLPPQGSSVDKQEVLCNTTQAVTTLTVAASGSNVTGAPTTLAANAHFRMRYDMVGNTWYQV